MYTIQGHSCQQKPFAIILYNKDALYPNKANLAHDISSYNNKVFLPLAFKVGILLVLKVGMLYIVSLSSGRQKYFTSCIDQSGQKLLERFYL